jgi:uncharacterized protein with HEPN domain
VSRNPSERFTDIVEAIERCLSYRDHLESTDATIASMAYDAVLRNLAVIGEAVRALPEGSRELSPDTPWASIAGLRNVVVHEYFRVRRDLVLQILDQELTPLAITIRQQLRAE